MYLEAWFQGRTGWCNSYIFYYMGGGLRAGTYMPDRLNYILKEARHLKLDIDKDTLETCVKLNFYDFEAFFRGVINSGSQGQGAISVNN